MKYRLIIRPEAEADLADAFSWYEDKRRGLGYDFLLQVEVGLKHIEKAPETHPISYQGTRKYLTKRFPYKIVYILDRETVVVLAILHGKRSEELLKERIESSKQ
ncbi:MAG: type II toxin-antitoxin system RelE/ParE family toxin [Nitrospirae bacterium]|nr:type II toxin-antitoxin system RelE/ParE family toxin [Nitrospirota bacterium]MCL5977036.1 type II toxin-antitoxin system RelE/ParE family toxin [Nitrospirota bacterium]